MPLKAIIEKIDDVNEALREHYQEGEDGKFHLSVEPVNGFSLENVEGLKSALGKEKGTRSELENKLKSFKDIDPKKARDALKKVDELADLDPQKDVDKLVDEKIDAITKQLTEKHSQEMDKAINVSIAYKDQLSKLLIDNEALKAISKHDGTEELLLPIIRNRIKLVESDENQFSVRVMDTNGNPAIKDAQGAPQDLDGLVSELKQDDVYAAAFKGTKSGGAGSAQPNKSPTQGKSFREAKSLKEKVAAIDAIVEG